MKKLLSILFLFPLIVFGQVSSPVLYPINSQIKLPVERNFGISGNIYQDALDAVIGEAEIDQGFSVAQASDGSGGVYTSTARTTLATSGDAVSFKGFGSNLWSTPNLEPANYTAPDAVWFSSWSYPQVWTYGDDPAQAFIAQENGPQLQYQTGPGSISPAFTCPCDFIAVWRKYPDAYNETNGLYKVSSATNFRWKYGNGGELALGDQTSNGFADGNTIYTRMTIDGSGNWEFRMNDLDAVTPHASGSGYTITGTTEHWFGSNGHPMANHHYFRAIKFGTFSGTALANFETNFAILWPTGKPSFPYDDGMWNITFNSTENTWSIAEGTFTGGSGTRGTFTYQWYYWSDDDVTEFPLQNKLDEHTAVPSGIGGTNATLDRDDILSLYDSGETPAGATMWFMRVTYVYDNLGTPGHPIVSEWIVDNVP